MRRLHLGNDDGDQAEGVLPVPGRSGGLKRGAFGGALQVNLLADLDVSGIAAVQSKLERMVKPPAITETATATPARC